MQVIDERDERTAKRKAAKRKFDKLITLSYNPEFTLKANPRYKEVQRITLLEEGAVVMSTDVPYFFIAKGTLERALNKLPDDYENYVDLGHMPFETFPISLGVFKKSDLHLVNRANGRKAIEVDVRLNYKNPVVQALVMQPYDLSVSARFYYSINAEMTQEISELLDAYVPVIDDIDLINYAIVGEPGNVNSDGLELKGGTTLDLKELANALEGGENEMNLDALNDALDKVYGTLDEEETSAEETSEEEVAEETSEETAEEAEETAEEASEEEVEEESSDEAEEEESEPEASGFAVALEEVERLTRRVTELEEENKSLKSQLSKKSESEKEFISKIKSMAVSKDERAVTTKPVFTDGFGE